MKYIYIFTFLSLFLIGCSDRDLTPGGEEPSMSGDYEYGYLTVTVMPTESGSRSDEDFAVGSPEENKINTVRFYFFDQELKAVKVKANGATYFDVNMNASDNDYNSSDKDKDSNIESTVTATIIIESGKGDDYKKPYYVAAVVNPTSSTPGLAEGQPISDLQAPADYSRTSGGFVMSSTVYKDKKKIYDERSPGKVKDDSEDSEIIAQLVRHKIHGSRLEALEDPATIYVERVLAKVSASVAITSVDKEEIGDNNKITLGSGEVIYKLSNSKIGVTTGEEDKNQDIYVKFLGWNVTADRNNSRLIKKINIGWRDVFDGWGQMGWNDSLRYRSYWAINPTTTSKAKDYNFGPFAAKTSGDSGTFEAGEGCAWNFGFGEKNDAKVSYTYLQENAGKLDDGTTADIINSKVIVAAQLVDKEGNPLTLVKWSGSIYNCTTEAAKNSLLDALASSTKLYIKKGDKYVKLGSEDIKFETEKVTDADEAYKENASPRYYVRIALSDINAEYAIYKSTTTTAEGETVVELDPGDGNGYRYNNEKVTKALESVGLIKYWNSGYTYYWVDIKHFGGDVTTETPEGENGEGESNKVVSDGIGKYGVVRNHWYRYTFTSVVGMGVPVADPDEIIYPEIPQDPPETYLGIELRILPWRKVYQGGTILGK